MNRLHSTFNRSFRRTALALIAVVLFAGLHPATANAQDGCGVGKQTDYSVDPVTTYDEYGDIDTEVYPCRDSKWEYGSEKDGIDSFVYADMASDSDDKFNTDDETLRIFCQDKTLGVWISVDYADSVGWSGSAKIRFDGGKTTSLPYTVGRTFKTIYPKSPNSFVSSFLKSKKVTIKIQTVNGFEVLVFTKSNLTDYRKKFAFNGCKF